MKLVAKLNIATLQQYTHVSSNYILHLIVYFVHKSWRKLWVFQVFQVCENLNGTSIHIAISTITLFNYSKDDNVYCYILCVAPSQ